MPHLIHNLRSTHPLRRSQERTGLSIVMEVPTERTNFSTQMLLIVYATEQITATVGVNNRDAGYFVQHSGVATQERTYLGETVYALGLGRQGFGVDWGTVPAGSTLWVSFSNPAAVRFTHLREPSVRGVIGDTWRFLPLRGIELLFLQLTDVYLPVLRSPDIVDITLGDCFASSSPYYGVLPRIMLVREDADDPADRLWRPLERLRWFHGGAPGTDFRDPGDHGSGNGLDNVAHLAPTLRRLEVGLAGSSREMLALPDSWGVLNLDVLRASIRNITSANDPQVACLQSMTLREIEMSLATWEGLETIDGLEHIHVFSGFPPDPGSWMPPPTIAQFSLSSAGWDGTGYDSWFAYWRALCDAHADTSTRLYCDVVHDVQNENAPGAQGKTDAAYLRDTYGHSIVNANYTLP